MIWYYGAPGPVCIYIVRNLYTKFSMVGFTLTEGIQISDSKLFYFVITVEFTLFFFPFSFSTMHAQTFRLLVVQKLRAPFFLFHYYTTHENWPRG